MSKNRILNRKARLALALTSVLSLALLSACSENSASNDGQGPVSLIMASYQPPGSAWRIAYEDWANKVETQTNGRVKIEIHDNESLLTQADIMSGVASGQADIGFFINSFHPAELPLSSVVEIPFITHDAQAQVRAFDELYDTYAPLKKEYQDQGIEVAAFQPSTPAVMNTREPIGSPEELRNAEVRSIGYVSKALQAVGAQPATLTLGEVYEGLDRGVIDSNVTVFENTHALGLNEVAPYVTDIGTGGFTIALIGFNVSVWENLQPEDQETIRKLAHEAADRTLAEFAAIGETACQLAIDGGGTVTTWDENVIKDWKNASYQGLVDEWIATAGQNAPADEFMSLYLEKLEEHKKSSSYTPSVQICAQSTQ